MTPFFGFNDDILLDPVHTLATRYFWQSASRAGTPVMPIQLAGAALVRISLKRKEFAAFAVIHART